MSGYSWVAIISLFCYLFLLMTFLVAKRTEKVLNTFIALLTIMILWNSGSLGMRLQFWPSPYFWHHMSLFGTFMLSAGYYHFTLDYLEERKSHGRNFWLIFYLALFILNCFTGVFVPLPEVLMQNGKPKFLYYYDWHIYLLFLLIILTFTQLAFIIKRHYKSNRNSFQQLLPVIFGVLIVLLGHAVATLPMFTGFPIDVVSGVINALFLFYALYKKRLFRMTLLLSKTNYCIIAMVLAIVIFSNFALPLQRFAMQEMGMEYAHAMVIIAVVLLCIVAILYVIVNAFFDAIFVRSEQQQSDLIARFGEEISHMMNVEDILQAMTDAAQTALGIDRIFVFVRSLDGQYRIEHTTNPLEERSFTLTPDHPLVSYFKTHGNCASIRDFSRSTLFRSMWEKEKMLLTTMQIECFSPLISENELVGLVMLAGKQDRKPYQPQDLNFLQSLSAICSIAVKKAYTYETALEEARRDELTGLINRKYFFELLDQEFEKHRDTALSLCLLNIDDFRLYNQLYGTNEGNDALQRVSDILAASVNGNGYAARIGGKEFALILPGYDIYSAKCLAENVTAQINEIHMSASGETHNKLTASIGICAAPYMASSSKELFQNADTAVFTVKRNGKNAILMYSADINRRKSNPSHKSGYNEHASTIQALTAAIDAKDHYTFQHSRNVAYYASELAKAAGMPEDIVEICKEAGLLHDIGKIGVREDILNKPGRLTAEEYDVMKTHVENAVNIIRYLPSLDYAIPAVFSHHERYDGRGYPRKLAGEDIPITGRILCIADAFDAITSKRSYKKAVSPDEALKILRQEAGYQFDPHLVEVFAALVENRALDLQDLQGPARNDP